MLRFLSSNFCHGTKISSSTLFQLFSHCSFFLSIFSFLLLLLEASIEKKWRKKKTEKILFKKVPSRCPSVLKHPIERNEARRTRSNLKILTALIKMLHSWGNSGWRVVLKVQVDPLPYLLPTFEHFKSCVNSIFCLSALCCHHKANKLLDTSPSTLTTSTWWHRGGVLACWAAVAGLNPGIGSFWTSLSLNTGIFFLSFFISHSFFCSIFKSKHRSFSSTSSLLLDCLLSSTNLTNCSIFGKYNHI